MPSSWVRKNRVLRKSYALLQQMLRAHHRWQAGADDYVSNPPVLCNSFPKSGTHLLLQILEALPGKASYGSFLASTPALTLKERSRNSHLRAIQKIVPGEVLPAHLYYDPAFESTLDQKHCVSFFIYRDLRDVVVSDVMYLTFSYRTHRMHRYFAGLTNMESRITLAIEGAKRSGYGQLFPNIAERFRRYEGWLESWRVLPVRFETLVGEERKETLIQIVKHYNKYSPLPISEEQAVEQLQANIDPDKSHTFRKGDIGGWRNYFSEENKKRMKIIAGDLLIRLGYEPDLSW